MIIDFHTHCYPKDLAARALSHVKKSSPFMPYYDGTMDGLFQNMSKNGVDISLTLHQASSAKTVKNVNNWAIECNNQPNLYGFGSVHPDFEDYKAELARLKEAGIKGLKFQPYHQRFNITDKKMYPIYEAAASLDMVMLFHCGIDLAIAGDLSSPKQLRKLAADFGGAKFVGAHLGGMAMWDEAFDQLLGRNIYLDTSFAFRYLSDEQRRRLTHGHDHSLLLFGSDSPYINVAHDIGLIREYFPDSHQKILGENAKKLLDIADNR